MAREVSVDEPREVNLLKEQVAKNLKLRKLIVQQAMDNAALKDLLGNTCTSAMGRYVGEPSQSPHGQPYACRERD